MSAHNAAGKILHRLQTLPGSVGRLAVRAVQDRPPPPIITAGVQQAALRLQSVPTRSSRFLLVALERLGHRGVNHVTDIRLVDPHAEGHRRDNRIDSFPDKGVLVVPSRLVAHPRMVRTGLVTTLVELFGGLFDVTSRDAVDDARFVTVAIHDGRHLIGTAIAKHDLVRQVGSVKRSNQHLRPGQFQLLDHVLTDLGGGRCRVGVYRYPRQPLFQELQLPVFGPKIVAPLADTVCLVDGHQGHVGGGQRIEHSRLHQPFRGNVQQLQVPDLQVLKDTAARVGFHAAVETRRRDTGGVESIDLILHQGNQRRDNQAHPGTDNSRSLETQGLAAPGRKHHDRIPVLQHTLHRLLL